MQLLDRESAGVARSDAKMGQQPPEEAATAEEEMEKDEIVAICVEAAQAACFQTHSFRMGMWLGMRMGMCGPTPMRLVADRPHNTSSSQGHCHWPSMQTHSQPHSGGISSRRFHWGTAEHVFFDAFF